MTTPAAAQARDLAAASLLRAFLADDEQSGMLIIAQNTPDPEQAAMFLVAIVKLAAATVLKANGYDIPKTLAVLDAWIGAAARRVPP